VHAVKHLPDPAVEDSPAHGRLLVLAIGLQPSCPSDTGKKRLAPVTQHSNRPSALGPTRCRDQAEEGRGPVRRWPRAYDDIHPAGGPILSSPSKQLQTLRQDSPFRSPLRPDDLLRNSCGGFFTTVTKHQEEKRLFLYLFVPLEIYVKDFTLQNPSFAKKKHTPPSTITIIGHKLCPAFLTSRLEELKAIIP
jgi:hypothetical protein